MRQRLPLLRFALGFCPLLVLGWSLQDQSSTSLKWTFDEASLANGFASSGEAPLATGLEGRRFAAEDVGGGMILNRDDPSLVVHRQLAERPEGLPTQQLTLSAWVAIERTQRWGGVISCLQDNGEAEKGVILGYADDRFSFGLASTGTDDGDGQMTYLNGSSPIVLGRWHHVAATFDGAEMRLYVDGELDGVSTAQSGDVLYDWSAPLVLGAYEDANERFGMDGRMLEASIEPKALSAAEVRGAFDARAHLTTLEPWTDLEFDFLVQPYLTWPTTTEISVLFETTTPCAAEIHYWKDTQTREAALIFDSIVLAHLQELRLSALDPDQKYFYAVEVKSEAGEILTSETLSFRSAASPGKPFTFAVVSDTQTQGDVAKRVSDLAFMHRPNLVVHGGDLVDTGGTKSDWTDTFFPSMQPLLGHVPIMPVLGNHEQDASLYYDYMSLPSPERWYSFTYGDAEFFMIDGNRSLADESAQFEWLGGALESSEATWKFAVLHQPPYTSDSDDYGDTTKESSFRGDANVRNIISLLEAHGVDICFSGHVHDYERTFPIRGGEVTEYEDGGIFYVTAAGAGGSLEDFDRTNTWFGHKKARYHHFVYVAIHGTTLEFQAIDEEGRLFDVLTLKKRTSNTDRRPAGGTSGSR